MAVDDDARRGLRVLALPAFSGREADPFSYLLNTAIAARGVRIESFTIRLLLRGTWDIVHVHWPEFVLSRRSRREFAWRAATFILALRLARWRGTAVVWTVHNLRPHEQDFPSRRMADLFWRAYPRQVDCFVSMTRVGVDSIHENYPFLRRRRHAVIRRGLYPGEYLRDLDRLDARRRLELPEDARVYTFLGMIRRYKQVPALIRAFRQMSDGDCRLLIAGMAPDDALATEVTEAARGDDRIVLRLGLVPPEEVQLYLTSADLVVLPYAETFNSGAAMLALEFQRPILVPDVPTFRELQDDVGSSWVRCFRGPISVDALRQSMLVETPRSAVALDRFDWDEAGAQTVELYETCLAGGERDGRRTRSRAGGTGVRRFAPRP